MVKRVVNRVVNRVVKRVVKRVVRKMVKATSTFRTANFGYCSRVGS